MERESTEAAKKMDSRRGSAAAAALSPGALGESLKSPGSEHIEINNATFAQPSPVKDCHASNAHHPEKGFRSQSPPAVINNVLSVSGNTQLSLSSYRSPPPQHRLAMRLPRTVSGFDSRRGSGTGSPLSAMRTTSGLDMGSGMYPSGGGSPRMRNQRTRSSIDYRGAGSSPGPSKQQGMQRVSSHTGMDLSTSGWTSVPSPMRTPEPRPLGGLAPVSPAPSGLGGMFAPVIPSASPYLSSPGSAWYPPTPQGAQHPMHAPPSAMLAGRVSPMGSSLAMPQPRYHSLRTGGPGKGPLAWTSRSEAELTERAESPQSPLFALPDPSNQTPSRKLSLDTSPQQAPMPALGPTCNSALSVAVARLGYTLDSEPLCRGRFGAVILKGRGLGVEIAVKKGTMNERNGLRRLTPHPHIVELLAHGLLGGNLGCWVGVKYYPVGDAAKFLRREAAAEWRGAAGAALFGVHIGSALEAVHAAGLCHLDVKLENAFVEGALGPGKGLCPGVEPIYRLADFGLCSSANDPSTEPKEGDGRYLCRSYLTCRAPHFRAPADVYALGCCVAEVLMLGTHGRRFKLPVCFDSRAELATGLEDGIVSEVARSCMATDPLDRPAVEDVPKALKKVL
eukprot:Hpha_TRINITY_DN16147_c3_g1::TRINITY_DN16147_c3_g1_i1::g.6153::m.6153